MSSPKYSPRQKFETDVSDHARKTWTSNGAVVVEHLHITIPEASEAVKTERIGIQRVKG